MNIIINRKMNSLIQKLNENFEYVIDDEMEYYKISNSLSIEVNDEKLSRSAIINYGGSKALELDENDTTQFISSICGFTI